MKRPTSITIIAALFIVSGIWAGLEILYGFFSDHLNLNFAIFMAPIGFGLLKGRASSKDWAKFWVGLGILMLSILLILFPFMSDTLTVDWFGQPVNGSHKYLIALVWPITFLLFNIWIWKCLKSPKNAPFFDDFDPSSSMGATTRDSRN